MRPFRHLAFITILLASAIEAAGNQRIQNQLDCKDERSTGCRYNLLLRAIRGGRGPLGASLERQTRQVQAENIVGTGRVYPVSWYTLAMVACWSFCVVAERATRHSCAAPYDWSTCCIQKRPYHAYTQHNATSSRQDDVQLFMLHTRHGFLTFDLAYTVKQTNRTLVTSVGRDAVVILEQNTFSEPTTVRLQGPALPADSKAWVVLGLRTKFCSQRSSVAQRAVLRHCDSKCLQFFYVQSCCNVLGCPCMQGWGIS
jgi:hypothetical protein